MPAEIKKLFIDTKIKSARRRKLTRRFLCDVVSHIEASRLSGSFRLPARWSQTIAGQRKDYLGGNCDNNIDNIYRNGQGWTLRKSYIVMISTINPHGCGNLRDAFVATFIITMMMTRRCARTAQNESSSRILKRLVCLDRSDYPRDGRQRCVKGNTVTIRISI